jgi:hypothetical protein
MMDGMCSPKGEYEKCVQNSVGKSEGKDSLKDLNINGTVIRRRLKFNSKFLS